MKRLISDIRGLDFRVVITLVVAVVVLLVIQFRAAPIFWEHTEFLKERFPQIMVRRFWGQVAWALCTFVCFGVIPFLMATLVLRMKPREFGFSVRGFWRHIGIYVLFYLFMLPFILWAADQPQFAKTYPFAYLARESDRYFLYWELAYFLQFCALEMFFRGFLIFSLERRFGLNGIFVMVIPYAMIHLHKPPAEAFGAIAAGIILGYMALRTRSFYGGILLHFAVAFTMDFLGRIPTS